MPALQRIVLKEQKTILFNTYPKVRHVKEVKKSHNNNYEVTETCEQVVRTDPQKLMSRINKLDS